MILSSQVYLTYFLVYVDLHISSVSLAGNILESQVGEIDLSCFMLTAFATLQFLNIQRTKQIGSFFILRCFFYEGLAGYILLQPRHD